MSRAVALGLVMVMATGCGIALNAAASKGAPGSLNTKGDARVIASVCLSGYDTCESVTKVGQPTELSAYAFTYKQGNRGVWGTPAGEFPITLYIVGEKRLCDAAETRLAGLQGKGMDMKGISESCHGPFYFVKDR